MSYGDSFLFVGGSVDGGDDYSLAIYKYDLDSEQWTEMPCTLSKGKSSAPAMFINVSIFPDCPG